MKKLLLLLVLSIAYFETKAQDLDSLNYTEPLPVETTRLATFKPSRSTNYTWNSSLNNWEYRDTTFNYYNSEGSLMERIAKVGEELFDRSILTYNNSNLLVESLYQRWDGSNWFNFKKTIYEYDNYGYRILQEIYNYDTNGWTLSWGNKTQTTYTNNKLTEEIILRWISGNYRNDIKRSLSYDNNGEFKEFIEEKWSNSFGIWEKRGRYYNFLIKDWGGTIQNSKFHSYDIDIWFDPNWMYSERVTKTYTANEEITLVEKYYNGSFTPFARETMKYDNFQNFIESISESHNGSNWVTDYKNRNLHTYNNDNSISVTISQTWYPSLGYVNSSKSVYDYFSTTSINKENPFKRTLVFPNPSTDFICIHAETKGDIDLTIYSLTGQIVLAERTSSDNRKVEVEKLPDGIYFLKLQSNSEIRIEKIIIKR